MKTLLEIEKEHIIETLKNSESLLQASKSLGISYRGLRDKIKYHGIDRNLGRAPVLIKNHKTKGIPVLCDDDFNCMTNMTPEERDFAENRNPHG